MAKQTPNFGFTKPEPNDYYDVNVQNENWDKVDELLKEVATSGGVSPSNVTDARVKVANGKLTIFWSDPGDTVVGEDTICTWKGTKLVQKVGSYPENAKDGTVLVDNQVLDAYKTNGFEINGLTNGVTYYFALFPYSDTGATNISTKNLLSGTPQPYKIMTAVIDLSDSNPNTCVSYADDAVGVVAGSAEWDEFFGHYPVLFKDGAEVGKLNPNNFDQFEDGTTADISSGASGDAMICFPRRGLTITTSGTKLTISMTDNPDNNAFEYNAHKRGNVAKEKFYIGVYKGYVNSSKLRSLKGKTPSANQTIDSFRSNAHNMGTGYEQSAFYQLTFRQAMFVLKYKTLDSQMRIGNGYVGTNVVTNTGGTESWGMDCENIKKTNLEYMTDSQHHVKCFGIEDFWGNMQEYVDGVKSTNNYKIMTTTDNFNDAGTNYIEAGETGITAYESGYMSAPCGTTKTGFVMKAVKGSSSTYFCDSTMLSANVIAHFGGSWASGVAAGLFNLVLTQGVGTSHNSIGARLMYL